MENETPKPQNSPWDPRYEAMPWIAECSPLDPRCSKIFYLAILSDAACSNKLFACYEDALLFLREADDHKGSIYMVNTFNRMFPKIV